MHVHVSTQNALDSCSSLGTLQLGNIDCTGLDGQSSPNTTTSVFVLTSIVSPSMAFLVLHYMATDSASNKCHVAPSHRRFAHSSSIAGMKA